MADIPPENPQPPEAGSPIIAPVVFGVVEKSEVGSPSQKKPDIGMLSLFVGILLTCFFALLPMNHVEINWELSAVAYLAIIIGVVWTFLTHARVGLG